MNNDVDSEDEVIYKSEPYKRVVLGTFLSFISGMAAGFGGFIISEEKVFLGIFMFIISLFLFFGSIAWVAYKLFSENDEGVEEGEEK